MSISVRLKERKVSGYMTRRGPEAERRALRHGAEADGVGFSIFAGIVTDAQPADDIPDNSMAIRIYAVQGVSQADIAEICYMGVPVYYNSPAMLRRAISLNPDGVLAKMVRLGRTTIEELAGPRLRNAVIGFAASFDKFRPISFSHILCGPKGP